MFVEVLTEEGQNGGSEEFATGMNMSISDLFLRVYATWT
jgi:hypothetical protein